MADLGRIVEVESQAAVFVGDPHLHAGQLRCRRDVYPETCLAKLDQVYDLAEEHRARAVVLLGDVFHQRDQPIAYLSQVVALFARRRAQGFRTFSLLGNHDLAYRRLDSEASSPLGVLFRAGVVEPLGELRVKGLDRIVRGFHFTEPLEPAPCSDMIACAHLFYENSLVPEESLTGDQVAELGYATWVLGHDHAAYKIKQVGEATVRRPGSLTRGTSHTYNLQRRVAIDVVKAGGEWVRVPLAVQSVDEVFCREVFEAAPEGKFELDGRQFDELVSSLQGQRVGESVFDLLDRSNAPEKIRILVGNYLTRIGVLSILEGS